MCIAVSGTCLSIISKVGKVHKNLQPPDKNHRGNCNCLAEVQNPRLLPVLVTKAMPYKLPTVKKTFLPLPKGPRYIKKKTCPKHRQDCATSKWVHGEINRGTPTAPSSASAVNSTFFKSRRQTLLRAAKELRHPAAAPGGSPKEIRRRGGGRGTCVAVLSTAAHLRCSRLV